MYTGATNRSVRVISYLIFLFLCHDRPQEIDEAARRRLVKRLYIPLPDNVARRQIVMNLLKEQPFSLSEDDLDKLCHQTEGNV